MDALPRHNSARSDYGEHEEAIVRYREEGTRRALAMTNRGPLTVDATGKVTQEVVDAYNEFGFYVFEGVLSEDELGDLEADVADLLDRAPSHRGSKVDRHGRPALGSENEARSVTFAKPLADPVGGTEATYGRHQAKMIELDPPEGAPEEIVQLVSGALQFSEAYLRLYGHPSLLAFAEAIHGKDFTPFHEAIWIKQPGLGGSVAWHQDGFTHWDSPDLDENTHGFNYMAQVYGCDAENGLWVIPGSHRNGKLDIKQMVADAGSDRIPSAVPLICAPGDVAVTNRQAIHGSFANTSDRFRVSMTFGFHRRSSVLNVRSGGVHSAVTDYTDDYIRSRSKLIQFGIEARKLRFPKEKAYVYEPFVDRVSDFAWNSDRLAELRDYNLQDLGI
ncbi:MAG: phytanoyl-CoA dioxygenase family protein [Gammaproteobacteria bacterium]|nr:phytanoyl-CoA dioxygenase family protein [Gammaproteobacteria bacterium]